MSEKLLALPIVEIGEIQHTVLSFKIDVELVCLLDCRIGLVKNLFEKRIRNLGIRNSCLYGNKRYLVERFAVRCFSIAEEIL